MCVCGVGGLNLLSGLRNVDCIPALMSVEEEKDISTTNFLLIVGIWNIIAKLFMNLCIAVWYILLMYEL